MTQLETQAGTLHSANGNQAFLAFSLGPVQSFIEAARSVRDLWTGSYLLSWLTFEAMAPILEDPALGPDAFVFPAAHEHPLWLLHQNPQQADVESLLRSSLPNAFLAELPSESVAQAKAKECEVRFCEAWKKLCGQVGRRLDEQVKARELPSLDDWNQIRKGRWERQLQSFFDLRFAVLPWDKCDAETSSRLLGREIDGQMSPEQLWTNRWYVLGALLEAQRMVRHVPQYRESNGRVPGKCSLMGSYEQMGPAELDEAAAFWSKFAESVSLRGTRTRSTERLCAVGLVKRFAWPGFFVRHFEDSGLEQRVVPQDLRYEDTATVAARLWLEDDAEGESKPLKPDVVRKNDTKNDKKKHRWSGHWLHWTEPNADEDDPMPAKADMADGTDLWEVIRKKRAVQGAAPTYYAILVLDGDNMGDRRRDAGRDGQIKISCALSRFSLHEVPEIVQQHSGDLIYAGGDDVLCLLPTAEAISCTRDLADKFAACWPKGLPGEAGQKPTVSAGVAVVHYKEDLRFALRTARGAEQSAKELGRNALMLTVCRRSGEHSSALCSWDFTNTLSQWVQAFTSRKGSAKQDGDDAERSASDRWAYHMAAELPSLCLIEANALRAELGRQLKRADEVTHEKLPPVEVLQAFDGYRNFRLERNRDADEQQMSFQAMQGFIKLCQSASFLARGRDE